MASKTSMAYHAYQAKSPMNQGKVEALRALLPVWRAGLTLAMSCWTRPFVQSGVLPRWIDSKGFPDMLSQRQWDSVDRQARAALDSWIALREDEFRKTVNGSTLSPDLKHALHRINLRHAWWESVADDAHKMARRIIKHLRERVPFPDMRRCRTMSMDGKIARVGTPVNAFHFQYWAVVSTLDKGHPVRIPLTVDPRMNENTLHGDEQAANHLQARINRDGSIDLHLMTVKAKARKRSSGMVIGMDWGLKSLFATSQGQLHGLKLYTWLQQRDKELTALTRALAKSGIRYRQSRRYRNLNKRIRDYTRNEVNRILNLLSRQEIREIVVEELDFRNGGLSKKMNRIISQAGRNAVKAKLKDLEDNKGITVTKVNPAYTSQECPSCGYVNPRNRPTQEHFRCTCCGYRSQADINASHNILARRSREDGWRRIGRRQILAMLLREHDERFHPTGGHAAKSAATPRVVSTTPRVKATSGRKYH